MVFKKILVFIYITLTSFLSFSADYYWVGGSGLWSEVNGHWATTSGGNTFHSIIPTSTDNVIFDENSFSTSDQIVTLDGNFANCLSMDWSSATNNPEFRSDPGGTLYIFGSLTFNDNMTVNLNTDIEFQSQLPAQTIYSGGNQLTATNISFSNPNGGWELLDSLNVGTNINLTQGSLNTNGNSVVSSQFNAANGIELNMENSYFHMDYNYQSRWNASGTASIINATNSTIYSYSVGVGTGYVFNDIYVTTRSIYGDSATIQNLTLLGNTDISLTNSEVQYLTAEGNKTTFKKGPNFFHKAEITSEIVNFPTPAWYENHVVDQEFDSLIFTTPGVVISMDASTQKVNNHLHVAADCENYSEIKSLVPGSPVLFETPVNVNLDYIRLADVHISGGGTYTASNAIDNGGNAGWALTEIIGNDLYWIGASSNDWNDGGNWSLTSGGTPYGCSPTLKDNVFFDANSFSSQDTVEIISSAFAKNIDWTGAGFIPLLKGSDALNIGGSLKMIEDMSVNNYGAVNFISCETGNTIEQNGNTPTRGVIKFDCPEGEWTILDSLTTGGAIYLNSGSVIADQIKISADQFYILDSTSLSLDNAEVELTYYDGWEIGKGVNLNASTTEFHMNSGQYYSIPRFQGGTGYNYGNIYLEADPTYGYSITCDSCEIDSIIGAPGKGYLTISNTNIDYVNLVSTTGSIKSDNSYINELVINTTEQVLFNTKNYSYEKYKKLRVGSLIVQNPAVEFVLEDTLEIINTISIPSDCNTFFSIRSKTQGVPAYLIAPDNLILDYVSIQDITVGSGTNYQANNSIDKGGNTNWQFTSLVGQKLYWVGGEGDWDNGNNWSLTSGGAPLGCVPSPLDTAIFDENSFDQVGQTVEVTAGINITTMDWSAVTNSPIFKTSGDLNFNGSLIYSENMEVNTPSSYLFNSCTTDNIIQTGNHELTDHYDYPVSFNCATGSWTLQDTLAFEANLNLNQGALITNGNTIKARYFDAQDFTSLDIRNSDVIIRYGWTLNGSNIDFQSDSSFIHSTYSTFNGGSGYSYWDVEYLRGSVSYIPDIKGNNLTFHKLTVDDVNLRISSSVVDSLVTIGEQTTIIGTGNKFAVAELNSTKKVYINKGQEFDILNINNGGVNIVFGSEQTQTVNKELNIAQEPSFPIYFSASTQGTQAHINFLGTKPPCSEFLFLRDNNIYGPTNTPFYAGLDSDDIDNNTGWLFETNADCNTLLCEFEGVSLDLGDDIPLFCFDQKFEVEPLGVTANYQWEILSGIPNPKDTLLEFTITETDTVVLTLSTEICTISDTVVATKGDCSVIPFEICEGDSALLKPINAGVTQNWNTSSTEDSIYAKATGFYWVDNDDGFGTIVRDSFYVDIITLPAINLGNDTVICNGDTFNYVAPNGYESYLWSTGETNQDFQTDTTVNVWLEASIKNCTVSDTLQVISEVINFNGFPIADTTFCNIQDSLHFTISVENVTYTWENGDTGFENGERTLKGAGIYWIEMEGVQGCKVRDSLIIALSTIDPIDLGNDTSLCDDAALEINLPKTYDEYLWSDGSTSDSLIVNTAGVYKAAARLGSCVVTDSIEISTAYLYLEGALGQDTTLCPGDSLSWAATLTNIYYKWENGDNGFEDIERTVKDSGIYALEVSAFGCFGYDTIRVDYASDVAINLGNDTTLCDGEALSFNIPNNYSDYLWSNSDTDTSAQINTSGKHWVTASTGDCSVSDTIEIVTYNSPAFSFGGDTTLCPGDTLRYLETVPGVNFSWNNEPLSNGSTNKVIAETGKYWLDLEFNGCITSDTINVIVVGEESISLGKDTVLCNGANLQIDLPNTFDTYLWSDGTSSSSNQISSAGKHWLKVTTGLCSASDTIEIVTYNSPAFSFGGDTTLCPGDTLRYLETVPGVNFSWNNEPLSNGSTNKVIAETGKYWLDIEFNSCITTDTINVIVADDESINLGNDTVLCDGESVILNVANSFDSYLWSDGSSLSTVEINSPGVHSLIVKKGHCSVYDTIEVTANNSPVFSLGQDTILCPGDTFKYVSKSVGHTYLWKDSAVENDSTLKEIFTAGVYWLETRANECSSYDTLKVTISGITTSDLVADTLICSGEEINLNILSPYDSYEWSDGSTNNSFSTTLEGKHWVKLTQGHCSVTDTVNISSVIINSVFQSKDTTICPETYLDLDFSIPGFSYVWNDGEVGNDNVKKEFSEEGIYWIDLTNGNCSGRDSLTINIYEVPELFIGNDTSICSKEGLLLSLPKEFNSPIWSDGENSNQIIVFESGTYNLTAAWGDCEVESNTVNLVLDDELCEKIPMVFPTAFTPNGDGVNDKWVINGINNYPASSLRVFNRWGFLIFESDDYQNSWDGGDNSFGTYYFILENDELSEKITGTITILK